MSSTVPIVSLGGALLVSIQEDLTDNVAEELQDRLMQTVGKRNPHGVLIDVTTLEIIDTFIGRILGTIAASLRVMGVDAVLVGVRPAVAITLVELGMTLPGVKTALTAERGLALLAADHDPPGAGLPDTSQPS